MNKNLNSRQDNSVVIVDGQPVHTPGFKILDEIGRGANAVVFQAIDELLSRKVAIKIWNKRGLSRAQFETSKIAQQEHQLIVRTYQFYQTENYAYAIMELIHGISCRAWLEEEQPIGNRIAVWLMYSAALKFIYRSEDTHGDPHVGNILVFPDPDRTYEKYADHHVSYTGVKIADMGTSKLTTSKKMRTREADIIWETARKILNDHKLSGLWSHPKGLSHEVALNILGKLFDFISFSSGSSGLSDRKSENASITAEIIMTTPLFNLHKITDHINKYSFIDASRFARRVNHRLFKTSNLMQADDIISSNTLDAYKDHQHDFLKKLKHNRDEQP